MDKVQVNDKMCEEHVLGEIITRKGAFFEVAGIIDEECFYLTKHKEVWRAINALVSRGEDVDIITTIAELNKQGSTISPVDVASLSEKYYYGDLPNLARRLRDLRNRRRLYLLGLQMQTAGVSETDSVDEIVSQLTNGINGLYDNSQTVTTLSQACSGLTDIINKNLKQDTNVTGTPTGFGMIDKKGGFQGSDLVIIAGETSNGKTSYALSVTKNAIESGKKIAFYSLEMTKEQLAARLVSQQCGVPSSDILYSPNLTSEDLRLIDEAIGTLPSENLYFDDSSTSNADSIILSIRNMKTRYDIDGAVIDYLQILNVNAPSRSFTREQLMGDTARRLKNLAKELDIWIIALSQLSRNMQDPIPNLARLRDSGQIAEAADVVILVYRPEIYGRQFPEPFDTIPKEETKGLAMIDVSKGRNIGTFKFLCNFNNKTTKFSDMNTKSNNNIVGE